MSKKEKLAGLGKFALGAAIGGAQKWKIPLDVFYGKKTEKSTGTNDFICT